MMACMTDSSTKKTAPLLTLRWPVAEPKTLAIATVVLAAGAYAVARPDQALAAVAFAAESLLLISPLILFGLIVTAAITASGSMALVATAFEGKEVRMIFLASLIGALTPVCGITVLPLVAGLLAARVALAPIMAFWLSSPITGPGEITVTAGMLGLDFALAKTLAAFGAGLLGGAVTLALTRAGYLCNPTRATATIMAVQDSCACDAPQSIRWAFWKEPGRRSIFRATALSTGRLMLIWLSLAFLAEYVLHAVLPPNLLATYVGGDQFWAVPLAAVVGAPIYLDSYAALPLIRALMEAGMSDGAALAFLVAGGIISAWAAIPVFALVRLPVFALYVGLAVVAAMLAGWGYGAFAG